MVSPFTRFTRYLCWFSLCTTFLTEQMNEKNKCFCSLSAYACVFSTFSNPNANQEVDIIFYTLNGSDPRICGIPYDDNEESGIGIVIPISAANEQYEPLIVQVVIGRLGPWDLIIWSEIEKQSFWNPDHLNHTKWGGGFSQSPSIVSGPHSFGDFIVVRVWPQRLTDIVKCAYSQYYDAEILRDKVHFWSDRWASRTVNVSETELVDGAYIDFKFGNDYLRGFQGPIWFQCSTSSRSPKVTAQNTTFSSLLMSTSPKHTQLFPESMRSIVSHS